MNLTNKIANFKDITEADSSNKLAAICYLIVREARTISSQQCIEAIIQATYKFKNIVTKKNTHKNKL